MQYTFCPRHQLCAYVPSIVTEIIKQYGHHYSCGKGLMADSPVLDGVSARVRVFE